MALHGGEGTDGVDCGHEARVRSSCRRPPGLPTTRARTQRHTRATDFGPVGLIHSRRPKRLRTALRRLRFDVMVAHRPTVETRGAGTGVSHPALHALVGGLAGWGSPVEGVSVECRLGGVAEGVGEQGDEGWEAFRVRSWLRRGTRSAARCSS